MNDADDLRGLWNEGDYVLRRVRDAKAYQALRVGIGPHMTRQKTVPYLIEIPLENLANLPRYMDTSVLVLQQSIDNIFEITLRRL